MIEMKLKEKDSQLEKYLNEQKEINQFIANSIKEAEKRVVDHFKILEPQEKSHFDL